jgi:amino acid permease
METKGTDALTGRRGLEGVAARFPARRVLSWFCYRQVNGSSKLLARTEKLYRIVAHPGATTRLARKLSLGDYFALAFGTMVGTRWLVLMDDWLGRSGPLGAILGFALGGVLLLPAGYVYGQWVQRLPDAAGEAAYTAQVFPPIVSYFTGWMMLLAYFIVCLWEAVAAGKLAAYIFPLLNSFDGLLQWWGEMSARMRAEFEWERTLMYTFEGGSLRRR